jgi:RsiW-degrading membrane proteinase PrsW (M82 family)
MSCSSGALLKLNTMLILIIITALLPVAILGWWIYRKDSAKPEPLGQLFTAFFYGIGSAFVSMVLAVPLTLMLGFNSIEQMNTLGDALSVSLFSAAIPEEVAKLTMLWLFLRKNPYYDEYLDGIVYAACIGLGFAGAENILYLLQSEDWLITGVVRGVTAVPAHFAIACAMGYFYSKRHYGDRSNLTAACILGVPIIIHWIYDALAFSEGIFPALSVVINVLFVLLIWWVYKSTMRRIKMLQQLDQARMAPPPFPGSTPSSTPPPLPGSGGPNNNTPLA